MKSKQLASPLWIVALLVPGSCGTVPLPSPALRVDQVGDAQPDPPSGTQSADEIAKSLANPNTPLATLQVKVQARTFTGDLPGADRQDSTTLLFQPTFPFPVGDEGDVIFWRPAVPVLFGQPVPGPVAGEYDQQTELGDIVMDLGYGTTSESGFLFAAGAVASLPTATDDAVGTGRFSIGPELLAAQFESWGLYGIFPSHQWDVAGGGDGSVNLTNVQAFLTFLPGDGWGVGSTPIVSYDWEDSQWTVPINLTISKTVLWGGTPWKLGMEINYYVEQRDAFGPEWMIGLNFAPVVENVLAGLFR